MPNEAAKEAAKEADSDTAHDTAKETANDAAHDAAHDAAKIALRAASVEAKQSKSMDQIAEQLGIGKFDTHLFICIGPDCCSEEKGESAWKAVKKTVKALNPDLQNARIYRTKVGCLRLCKNGPIAVSYPEGRWYQGVTDDEVPDLIEHIQSGSTEAHPLEFLANPLPAKK